MWSLCVDDRQGESSAHPCEPLWSGTERFIKPMRMVSAEKAIIIGLHGSRYAERSPNFVADAFSCRCFRTYRQPSMSGGNARINCTYSSRNRLLSRTAGEPTLSGDSPCAPGAACRTKRLSDSCERFGRWSRQNASVIRRLIPMENESWSPATGPAAWAENAFGSWVG